MVRLFLRFFERILDTVGKRRRRSAQDLGDIPKDNYPMF